MSNRTICHLPTLPPRSYQLPFWEAVDTLGIKKIILSYPRRAGKDLTSAMFLAREAVRTPGSYWILAPTKTQCVDIYWTGITEVPYICPFTTKKLKLKGSILDIAIPHSIRAKTNKSEHIITLINGSTIKLGGTSEESYVGQTGKGFIITEYSLPNHSDNVRATISPIITESNGWIIFNGTQREEDNRLNDLIKSTKDNKQWYTSYQTMEDVKQTCWVSEDGKYNINPELLGKKCPIFGTPYPNIQDEVDVEPHKENVFRREYINIPVETGVAGYYENQLTLDNNDTKVPWNPTKPVYTAWDLGIHDKTSIIFFQLNENNKPRIIDYFEDSDQGVGYYIKHIRSKVYTYGNHFVPVDSAKRSFQMGMDLIQFCKVHHDFKMYKLNKTISLKADIELVRSVLPDTLFDSEKTQDLVKALWSYHEDTNGKPCHRSSCKVCRGASHAADAFRYMCVAINAGVCRAILCHPPVLQTRVEQFDRSCNPTCYNGLPLFAS